MRLKCEYQNCKGTLKRIDKTLFRCSECGLSYNYNKENKILEETKNLNKKEGGTNS
jgi:hypothetical protein